MCWDTSFDLEKSCKTMRKKPEPKPLGLTPRENEIVGLIGDGLSTKEIAHKFGRSEKTVEKHISNLKEKLCEMLNLTHIGIADMTQYAITRNLSKQRFTDIPIKFIKAAD